LKLGCTVLRPLQTTLRRVLPKQNLLSIAFNLAHVGPDLPHTWDIGILPPHPHEHRARDALQTLRRLR
jgi:hypothetical protein